MAHVIIMPRQGNTVESCIITNWKVKEGEIVTPETAVCEVETGKAAFEVPAGFSGTVLKLLHETGSDVPVLQPIAVIGAPGENWQEVLEGAGNIEQGMGSSLDSKAACQQTQAANNTTSPRGITAAASFPVPCISPRARRLAEKEALPLAALSGSGPGGRIIERDVLEALESRPLLSVAAKAAGSESLPAAGSGLGGRVTVGDLASSAPLPIKGIRKIIADRMHRSLMETAQFTLNASAPAKKLLEIRAGFKTKEGAEANITINDLVLFAVSRTLLRFPYMNAHKNGDIIETFESVQLGIAVDTPRGLTVPVIRNAHLLSPAQISSEAKRLAAACQNGTVKPAELSGSSFTVTNLGSFGITSFTPVLNIPEVAILGVCAIEMKPVAQISSLMSFEPYIGFSLTINHQAVDGAPAARFLKALGETIAQIDVLFSEFS